MRILLIQPPFIADVIHFPFGIAYIASYLEQYGYSVDIVDINVERVPIDEILKKHPITRYDFIGVSALVNQYDYVQELCEKIKKNSQVPVIVGNGLGTTCHQLLLEKNHSVDVCVRGEGEETFKDIIENWSDLSGVKGITFRNDEGRVIVNPDRKISSDVDDYPIPSYHLFDMERYLHSKLFTTGLFEIRDLYMNKKIFPMLTARGCPFNCTFCSKVIRKTRLRSVENIVSEIKYLKEHYSIDGIHFVDELLAINKKRAVAIAHALKPLNIFWDCQCRVDTIDYETLLVMKEAGCVSVGFGIESGSQKILDQMKKNITVEMIQKALIDARNADLEVKVQLILGYPGEDWESLQDTITLFNNIRYPSRGFNYIIPLPGTELFDIIKKDFRIDDEVYLHHLYGLYFKSGQNPINLTRLPDKDYRRMNTLITSIINKNYILNL